MPFLSPNIGILVTGGDKGASYYIKDVGSSFLPAFSIKCVETTGAGDAFTAGIYGQMISYELLIWSIGFLAAIAMDAEAVLCSKAGADRALLMACAAGALTCTNEGEQYSFFFHSD
jgi:sugar/nucleoside kinase (ribokinase family)